MKEAKTTTLEPLPLAAVLESHSHAGGEGANRGCGPALAAAHAQSTP